MPFSWKKFFKNAGIILGVLLVIGVIIRIPNAWEKQKTAEAVAKIHATKLTMDDVMGKNLPPDPGADADKTIQGVDANFNGIRDDVELAIFKEYPNSAKTRAVLLQYALALQMEMTQTLVNTGTVTAVAEVGDRSYACVGRIFSRDDMKIYSSNTDKLRTFIKDRQLNTQERKKAQDSFYEKLGSYTSPSESCDIPISDFTN